MFGAHADANETGEILGHERCCETLPGRGVATARQEDPVRQAAQVFDASLTLLMMYSPRARAASAICCEDPLAQSQAQPAKTATSGFAGDRDLE